MAALLLSCARGDITLRHHLEGLGLRVRMVPPSHVRPSHEVASGTLLMVVAPSCEAALHSGGEGGRPLLPLALPTLVLAGGAWRALRMASSVGTAVSAWVHLAPHHGLGADLGSSSTVKTARERAAIRAATRRSSAPFARSGRLSGPWWRRAFAVWMPTSGGGGGSRGGTLLPTHQPRLPDPTGADSQVRRAAWRYTRRRARCGMACRLRARGSSRAPTTRGQAEALPRWPSLSRRHPRLLHIAHSPTRPALSTRRPCV